MDILARSHGKIDDALNEAGLLTGLPVDQLQYAYCFVLAYPIALLHRSIRDPTARHVVGLLAGLYFAWFTLRMQTLHSAFVILVTYLIVNIAPHGVAHKLAFVFNMLYLTLVCHIYRMLTDYMGWKMDLTGPQMLLTIKMTSFAFDYYDGHRPESELNDYQKKTRITKMPSLLEFYGYAYFFPTFLAGPALNFHDYISFIDLSHFKNKKIPSSGFLAVKRFFGALAIVGAMQISNLFPHSYRMTPEFHQSSFFYRVWYSHISMYWVRYPYFFGWLISEGACILAGYGYTGEKDGKPTWNKAAGVHYWGLETAPNMKGITDHWNISTDRWLRHYIYERVATTTWGKYNMLITYITSAVWHGFYPGYYVAFLSAALATYTARVGRRTIRPFFVTHEGDKEIPTPYKKFYDAFTFIVTAYLLTNFLSPFALLSFEATLRYYTPIYFFGHLITIGGLIGLNIFKRFVRIPHHQHHHHHHHAHKTEQKGGKEQ